MDGGPAERREELRRGARRETRLLTRGGGGREDVPGLEDDRRDRLPLDAGQLGAEHDAEHAGVRDRERDVADTASGEPPERLFRRVALSRHLPGQRLEALLGDGAQEGRPVGLSQNGGADPDLERRGALVATRLAAAKGIDRITLLSGASVAEENCWFPGTKAKWEAEAAVRASGVPHAIFHATFFMESLPRYVRGTRASVIGDQPKRWHPVAADDFAAMVSRAHADTRESGVVPVLGPEAMTMREALARYCALYVPGAKTGVLPFWMAGPLGRLPGEDELRTALPFFRYTSRVGESEADVEAAPFGAATTTLDEWCRRRKSRG